MTGNIAPREMAIISKPWKSYEDAIRFGETYLKMLPLIQFTYSKVNPVPVKSLARVLGLPAGELRRPYLNLTGRALRNGVAIVEGLGLAARYGFHAREDLIGADQPASGQIAEPSSEAPGTGSGACFIR